MSAIKEAEDALRSLRSLGDEFITLSERLEVLRCEAYDLAETIRDKKDEYDFSPQELDAVESRCDQLYRLKKKYGSSVEEMLAYLERSREELDRIEYADDRAQQLEQALKKRKRLRAKRHRPSPTAVTRRQRSFEERISRELRELDMPKLRFAIDFQEKDMGEDGVDAVAFLMSANVGEALRPIQKIASGGELSRIMLALKNVLVEQDSVMTMVFDEVDTGVSGRAAQRVAEKLAKLSHTRQVLCVTHLPQLAAMADTHFGVEKARKRPHAHKGRRARPRGAPRLRSPRLSGGDHPSETMLLGAEELLCAAENFKKSTTVKQNHMSEKSAAMRRFFEERNIR